HQEDHRAGEAEELADEELPAVERLGDDEIDGLAIELLAEEVHAEEQRDHGADEARAGEAEVLHHADLLVQRKFAEHHRERHQGDREHEQHRQHAVAHGLAQRVEGDRPDAAEAIAHAPAPSRASLTNSSSRLWRWRCSWSTSPPAATTARTNACATAASVVRSTCPSAVAVCSPG